VIAELPFTMRDKVARGHPDMFRNGDNRTITEVFAHQHARVHRIVHLRVHDKVLVSGNPDGQDCIQNRFNLPLNARP